MLYIRMRAGLLTTRYDKSERTNCTEPFFIARRILGVLERKGTRARAIYRRRLITVILMILCDL